MGGSSGGQSTPAQTVSQTKDPWSGASPYLSSMYATAENWRNSNVGYQPWTGPVQAPMDVNLQQSLTAQGDIARGSLGGTAGVLAGQKLGTDLMQNGGLSPELRSLYEQAKGDQNPYLDDIINASNRRISDKIGSSMSGAGRYGSGQHTDVAARAMSEAADPLLAQDYARRQQQQQDILSQGQDRAGKWAQIMPTLDAAQYAPAQQLGAVGQFLSNRSQLELQDQMRLYNQQQSYPWEQLSREAAILGGAGTLGGTTTTSSNPYTPSAMQRILGGGLAGAGLGASFGGPLGAGVGALGGGLLGLL